MIRDRIGRAALPACPPAVRQTRGLEMLRMVLEAGEQSGWALVRENGSLIPGGVRERRAITARAGARRLIADACCQAVLIWSMLLLVSVLNTEIVAGPTQQLLVQTLVVAAVLACALLFTGPTRQPPADLRVLVLAAGLMLIVATGRLWMMRTRTGQPPGRPVTNDIA